MSMTKKELMRVEALEEQIRRLKALRITDDVAPDVHPPKAFGGKHIGYLPVLVSLRSLNSRVEKCYTECYSHYRGPDAHDVAKKHMRSQGPVDLYSKESDAWRAVRRHTEEEMLRTLSDIDYRIAKALTKEAESV